MRQTKIIKLIFRSPRDNSKNIITSVPRTSTGVATTCQCRHAEFSLINSRDVIEKWRVARECDETLVDCERRQW